jgi:hypothetical protein
LAQAFKRDDSGLSDPVACWRTIAFDLARYDPTISKRIVENMERKKVDPGRADIELHFKYLVDDPLRGLGEPRGDTGRTMHWCRDDYREITDER